VGAPKPEISVVVPVFNSAQILPITVDTLTNELEQLDVAFEIILVDDGSGDESGSVAEELARTRPEVRAIRLHRNYGQHNATLCGIRNSQFDLVLTIDDDLQNPPDQISMLLDACIPGVDVVYGYPVAERQTRIRNLSSRLVKRTLSRLFGGKLHANHSAFRLFRRSLVDALESLSGPHISIDAALTWGAHRTVAVPVRFDERGSGASNYSFRKLTRHVLTMVTGYSTVPLRLVSAVGVIAGMVGFGLLGFSLLTATLQGRPPGFTFLASAVSLFAGVQLFAIGVLGEYIGEIHFRTMGMRPYSIRHREGFDSPD